MFIRAIIIIIIIFVMVEAIWEYSKGQELQICVIYS